jgi:hypothetical protein
MSRARSNPYFLYEFRHMINQLGDPAICLRHVIASQLMEHCVTKHAT